MVSTAHQKYTTLQRHRHEGPLALDPSTTALLIDVQDDEGSQHEHPLAAVAPSMAHVPQRNLPF